MSNFEDKIAELFRNSDEKLVEQPSERAREKFESRLQERFTSRTNRRDEVGKVFSRQLSLAAAVVGIIALGGLMTVLYFENSIDHIKNDGIAAYEPQINPPTIVPDAALQETTATAAGTITIDETVTEKESKPTTTANKMESKPQPIASTIPVPTTSSTKVNTQSSFEDNNTRGGASVLQPEELPRAEMEIQTNGVASGINTTADAVLQQESVTISKTPTKPSAAVPAPPAMPPAPKVQQIDAKKDYLPGNQTNTTPKYSSKEELADDNVLVEEEVRGTRKNSKVKSKKANAPQKETSKTPINIIDNLDWIVGEWRNEELTDNFEEWKQIDAYTLRGTAYFRQKNGKKVYTDKVEIRQQKGILYFYLPVDTSGKLKEYPLKKIDDDTYIFENEGISFPQRITLRQTGSNKFSIDLTNINSFQLQTVQGDYWRSRNNVLSDKVNRAMSKMTK